MQEYQEKFKKELEEKSKILELLERIGKFSIRKFKPLDTTKYTLDCLFDITKKELNYIIEILEYTYSNKSLGIFLAIVFKQLFIGENDFKTELLDGKISDLSGIIECIEQKNESNINVLINIFKGSLNEKEKIIFEKYLKNKEAFLLYILLKINKTPEILLNKFSEAKAPITV